MKWLHLVAFTLVLVGALNWGLIALFDLNLVSWLTKMVGVSGLENILYILVGASAVYVVLNHGSECKTCMSMKGK